MTRFDRQDARPWLHNTADGAHPDDPSDEQAEMDEASATIGETRSQLSDTLDAIEDRLNPENVKAQAKEIVSETIEQTKAALREATIGKAENAFNDAMRSTRGAGMTMLDTIKQNPIPAALIGIGVGWLLFKGQSTTDDRQYDYSTYRSRKASSLDGQGRLWMSNYDSGVYEPMDRSDEASSAQGLTDRLQDTAGQAAGQVQQMAGRMADSVQQTMGGLPDSAQDFAGTAQERVRRGMEDSPLIVGGIALAAGMVVGLAIPETERENQLLGEARDSLVEQVKDTARESVTEQMKDSARQIEKQVETSIDKAGEAVDSAIH